MKNARVRALVCLIAACAILLSSGYSFAASARQKAAVPLADARVGDTVIFGLYEQDDKERNGPEEIEWIVLDIDGDEALLLSKYCLDALAYHETGRYEVTWEDSDLRAWMNDVFYEDAFTDEEKELIIPNDSPNGRKQNYGRRELDTEDMVFALSLNEAKEFLSKRKLAAAEATEYAVASGIQRSPSNHNSWWWLRTPAPKKGYQLVMFTSGYVSKDSEAKHVTDEVGGVRPAIRVYISG